MRVLLRILPFPSLVDCHWAGEVKNTLKQTEAAKLEVSKPKMFSKSCRNDGSTVSHFCQEFYKMWVSEIQLSVHNWKRPDGTFWMKCKNLFSRDNSVTRNVFKSIKTQRGASCMSLDLAVL